MMAQENASEVRALHAVHSLAAVAAGVLGDEQACFQLACPPSHHQPRLTRLRLAHLRISCCHQLEQGERAWLEQGRAERLLVLQAPVSGSELAYGAAESC